MVSLLLAVVGNCRIDGIDVVIVVVEVVVLLLVVVDLSANRFIYPLKSIARFLEPMVHLPTIGNEEKCFDLSCSLACQRCRWSLAC